MTGLYLTLNRPYHKSRGCSLLLPLNHMLKAAPVIVMRSERVRFWRQRDKHENDAAVFSLIDGKGQTWFSFNIWLSIMTFIRTCRSVPNIGMEDKAWYWQDCRGRGRHWGGTSQFKIIGWGLTPATPRHPHPPPLPLLLRLGTLPLLSDHVCCISLHMYDSCYRIR